MFTKNRDRSLEDDVAKEFRTHVVEQARTQGLTSDEHFTVDGTLLEARSDAVRRFAALALRVSRGRNELIHVKQYLASASLLCRTGLMLATEKMGKDERKYLRQSLRLHDSLKKLCMTT